MLFLDTLEGFGSLDPVQNQTYTGLQDVDGGTIWSQKGQSYSQWVDLADVDASLALLPVGITDDPDSPFFSDQSGTWVKGDLRPAPLDEQANEEMATVIEFISFDGSSVPAVSGWGMIVMMLLALTAGTVAFGWRRYTTTA